MLIKKVLNFTKAFDEMPEMMRQMANAEPEGTLRLRGFDIPGLEVGKKVKLTVTGVVKEVRLEDDDSLYIAITVDSVK